MRALKIEGPLVEPSSYAGMYVELSGSSLEDKPIDVLEGSKFIESDTGHRWIFNEESTTWFDLDGGSEE